jgi:hypothetical protein
MVAAHHQLAQGDCAPASHEEHGPARACSLNLVRKTALQGIPRVVEPLLRVAYADSALAAQRAAQRSICRWRSMTSGTINSAARSG